METGPPPHPQLIQDAEHLKLLVVFHYLLAGVTFIFGSFPIIHVAIGWMMVSGKIPMAPASGSPPPPVEIGWLFILVGGGFILLAWTYAVLLFVAGRDLSARRRRNFCFVMACISCVFAPLGTALGIFTILILQRPTVRALFDQPLPGGYLNR